MTAMARAAVIDHAAGRVMIDGIEFPWHVAPEPQAEADPESRITRLTLEVLVDGAVTIRTSNKVSMIDPIFGDVTEFARTLVRKGFAEAFPWLEVPE